MIWLLIPLNVLAYIMVAARLQPVFAKIAAARCVNCSTGKTYYYKNRDAEPGVGHSGMECIVWPISAPFILVNSKYNPQVQRGLKKIDAYWENKEIEEQRTYLNELEHKAGIR